MALQPAPAHVNLVVDICLTYDCKETKQPNQTTLFPEMAKKFHLLRTVGPGNKQLPNNFFLAEKETVLAKVTETRSDIAERYAIRIKALITTHGGEVERIFVHVSDNDSTGWAVG